MASNKAPIGAILRCYLTWKIQNKDLYNEAYNRGYNAAKACLRKKDLSPPKEIYERLAWQQGFLEGCNN